MDLADSLNELEQHFECESWQITGLVSSPDLDEFQRQETEMKLFPVEWVNQLGNDEYGFQAITLFPTEYPDGDGGKMFLRTVCFG